MKAKRKVMMKKAHRTTLVHNQKIARRVCRASDDATDLMEYVSDMQADFDERLSDESWSAHEDGIAPKRLTVPIARLDTMERQMKRMLDGVHRIRRDCAVEV